METRTQTNRRTFKLDFDDMPGVIMRVPWEVLDGPFDDAEFWERRTCCSCSHVFSSPESHEACPRCEAKTDCDSNRPQRISLYVTPGLGARLAALYAQPMIYTGKHVIWEWDPRQSDLEVTL